MTEMQWPWCTPGLPDEYFQRAGVPLSKREVRVLTLAAARPAPGQVIWDVGAGSGGLTVEAALLAGAGTVWAVERSAVALDLLRENVRRFGLVNVRLVEGEAPEALAGLPQPDRVLVGGSGGRLPEILQEAASRLAGGGRVVANAVTLETAQGAIREMERLGLAVEAQLVQISRLEAAGGARIMRALNPVFVVAGEKGGGV